MCKVTIWDKISKYRIRCLQVVHFFNLLMMVICDGRYKITAVNKLYSRISKYDRDHFILKNLANEKCNSLGELAKC